MLMAMASSGSHRVQAPRTRPAKARKKPAVPGAARSPRAIYLAALAVAVVAAAVLIGVSLLGGGSGGGTSTTVAGGPETAALLDGIPQRGPVLGSPSAPVKLVEYADLQCVYCGVWARDVFPTIVRKYIRTGKVQLELRGLAFVGADSVTALHTALAASQQNKLWNVVELVYRNQGRENSGWVNDAFVRSTLAAVPGLDASRVLDARDGGAITALADRSARQARAAGVTGTPTFEVARKGEALRRLQVGALDVPSFTAPLDRLLAR